MSNVATLGPVLIRTFHPMACEPTVGHAHNYDHKTYVCRGRIRVEVEGETREYGEFEEIVVLAKVHHTITALTDDTVYICIFSHQDFGGIVIEKYVGNGAAYF